MDVFISTIYLISIRTPRVGSDNEIVIPKISMDDFNPHSPCGE